jgi:hypothetical protein
MVDLSGATPCQERDGVAGQRAQRFMTAIVRQAVILAGGRGTRLGSLAARIPKPLLPILGNRRFAGTGNDPQSAQRIFGRCLAIVFDRRPRGGYRMRPTGWHTPAIASRWKSRQVCRDRSCRFSASLTVARL